MFFHRIVFMGRSTVDLENARWCMRLRRYLIKKRRRHRRACASCRAVQINCLSWRSSQCRARRANHVPVSAKQAWRRFQRPCLHFQIVYGLVLAAIAAIVGISHYKASENAPFVAKNSW